jgi:VRR-NUC domain
MSIGPVLAQLPLTEADWSRRVLDCARLFKWRTAHFRPAQTAKGWRTPVQGDGRGWPDLVLLRPPRLILAELKSDTGRVSPEQSDWIAQLAEVPGIEVAIWRPSDWQSVYETLARESRP